MKRLLLPLLALSVAFCVQAAQPLSVSSPNGKLKLEVRAETGKPVTYALSFQGQSLISASPISMTLQNGRVLGGADRLKASAVTSHRGSIASPLYKKSTVSDDYNQLLLSFKDFSIVFRAYDEGVAYRFSLVSKRPFNVKAEQATFHFAKDWPCTVPYVRGDFSKRPDPITAQFSNSFENTYTRTVLSKLDAQKLMFLPLIVEADNGVKVNITESALENYPGMFLRNVGGGQELSGVFAPMPSELNTNDAGHLEVPVVKRHDYLTSCNKNANFPWRIINVATEDKQLTNNDLPWLLGRPSQGDFSWVKPGKVAWDWWNDWNLYGVDFRAGINNDTYKYYIDFAASQGIEYVILDEGWAVNLKADLMQVIPEIDLPMLARHAQSKGVGLILWAGYWAFDRDMEAVCKHYADMGIKGFKIDFMDRDDQVVVDFYRRAAETCAKYHMLADFHGAFKPSGLNRTWPNVINFEGVYGLEQMKWGGTELTQVDYDVTVPFIRMSAGPMDYTQGAMRNATRSNYRPVNSEGMSQGTRCHQLAEYVIFDSPLNMLCDSPSNYLQEPECTKYIAEIPTVWDETVALDGKIAEYVVTARRKGDTWYVGALTNWTPRDLDIDLGFLPEGSWKVEIYQDGVNADRAARDYKRVDTRVEAGSGKVCRVHLAPGGGWTAKFTRN